MTITIYQVTIRSLLEQEQLEAVPKGGGGSEAGFKSLGTGPQSTAVSDFEPSFLRDDGMPTFSDSDARPNSTQPGLGWGNPASMRAGAPLNFSRAGISSSFDPMPELNLGTGGSLELSDPLSRTVNPFSGTGLRTEGVSRVTASRDAYQARSFYDYIESGSEFPFAGIGRPSAIRIEFAEELRASLMRGSAGGAGAARTIDVNKLAEAITAYTRQSGGFVPTRANLGTLVDRISQFYFAL